MSLICWLIAYDDFMRLQINSKTTDFLFIAAITSTPIALCHSIYECRNFYLNTVCKTISYDSKYKHKSRTILFFLSANAYWKTCKSISLFLVYAQPVRLLRLSWIRQYLRLRTKGVVRVSKSCLRALPIRPLSISSSPCLNTTIPHTLFYNL